MKCNAWTSQGDHQIKHCSYKVITIRSRLLIFLGKYLEARATGQTNEAIKKLIGLQARTAHVIREGREFEPLSLKFFLCMLFAQVVTVL
jgi:hypothetical protein